MTSETEDLKRRVSKLEAAVDVQKDMLASHQKLLMSALPVLYLRDPSVIREWIARARSSSAFGHAAFDQPPPELLETIIESMEAVLQALVKNDSPRGGA